MTDTPGSQYLVNVLLSEHSHLVACRSLTAITSLVLLYWLYQLGKLFGDRRIGLLSSVLCAANLTFFNLSSLCKEDVLFWCLGIAGMVLAWRAANELRVGLAVAGGIAIGAATTTKYFGVAGWLLFCIPLVVGSPASKQIRIRVSILMALAAGLTVIATMPFLLTDTNSAVASITHMYTFTTSITTQATLPVYLGIHLPHLVGWTVIGLAVLELTIIFLWMRGGPLVLGVVPLAELLFLGLGHGFTMAYYICPVALFAIVLASAFIVRMLNVFKRFMPGYCSAGAAAFLVIAILLGPAFLPGSLKYFVIMTRPDTRLLAHAYMLEHARTSDKILITGGVAGMNCFGPPLLRELPPGNGVFAAAQRQASLSTLGPHYDFRVVGRIEEVEPVELSTYDWVMFVSVDNPSGLELGRRAEASGASMLSKFRLSADFKPIPEEHSFLWPYLTALDFEEIRFHSLTALVKNGRMGPHLELFHRMALENRRGQ